MNESGSTPSRIAFVHTVASLVDMFRNMASSALPNADLFHVLNESLLQDLLRSGPSAAITRRIVQQAMLAHDGGASLIVFTCSSTSPAIDVARQVISTPILKIDDPMADQAIAIGGRIGIVCTAQSTVQPSTALLKKRAEGLTSVKSIEPVLVSGAYDALFAGDMQRHDALVSEAATALSKQCDVLVLAQASLARLQQLLSTSLNIPILASPPLLMERLRSQLSES